MKKKVFIINPMKDASSYMEVPEGHVLVKTEFRGNKATVYYRKKKATV